MQALNKERNLYPGIFIISAATLLLELTLTRIFEVILWNNMAYMIVSSAIFGFGLGGVFIMLWPMPQARLGKVAGFRLGWLCRIRAAPHTCH